MECFEVYKYDLSVIVITYNQQEYIREALESILQQKHRYTYELIISDDCSTDSTSEIIYEYQQKYPEIIKVNINAKNIGLVKNYFKAIRMTSGRIIMQCAGDDYWLPGKIEKQMHVMNNEEIKMCYSTAHVFDDRTKKMKKTIMGTSYFSFMQLIMGNTIPAVSVCIRKDVINEYINDVKPEEQNWLLEDYPIWLWLTNKYLVHFIIEPTSVYRVQRTSVSRSIDYRKIEKFERSVFDIQLFFLQKNNMQLNYEHLFDLMMQRLMFLSLFNCNKNMYFQYYEQVKMKKMKMIVKAFLLRFNILFKLYAKNMFFK